MVVVKPPLFWRVVNLLRAWCERDERLLVEQWRSAFGPQKEPRRVIPFLNLRHVRDRKRRVA